MRLTRGFDLFLAATGLALLSPLLLLSAFAIWIQDRHTPFYIAPRIGLGGAEFRMIKFRSMRINADRTGVSSTSGDDDRVTRTGALLRRFKIDELPQLLNVLRGEMSLVGPRPQVPVDVAKYTEHERGLLSIRPGITDLASVVFSDEGEILRGSADPDNAYDQIIRPWKSRLALVYVDRPSLRLYVGAIVATAIGPFDRARSLGIVARALERLGFPGLAQVSLRLGELERIDPPTDLLDVTG